VATALLRSLLVAALCLTASARADTEFNYLLHCGGCHLENGAGDPPTIPDLRATLAIFSSFPDGRAYITQVPGSSQAPLNDTELAAVLNWMLRTFTPGARSLPFTAAEIAGYRSTTLMNPLQVRATLLAELNNQH
jgi:mono/diheme cytochrome c family protein